MNRRREAGATAVVMGVTAAVLAWMGRTVWCAQGDWLPWSFDTWSAHNSQHLVDAYSLSHVLHGPLFIGLLFLVFRQRVLPVAVPVAAALEGVWEIAENTPAVIEHYRANTISLDYTGDSIANSMADITFCALGAVAARRLKVWQTALLFIGTELVLLAWIRDSLLLNIVMLVYPLEFIKTWQAG